MKKYLIAIFAGGLILAGSAIMTVNAEEQVYGWQMMTEQERNEYMTHMQSLKTEQEREQYRAEHHKMMQERAKERGVTLPDMPGPGTGKGQGGGMGPGGGMAPGSGMGPGGGPGKKCGGR